MNHVSRKFSQISPSSTLAVSAKIKEMAAHGIDVAGFGAGEPDFDTPDHIKQAAISAINAGFTKYTPAAGTIELRDAVARKLERENGLHYNRNEIVISNGAKHSLTNVMGALCDVGDEVIIPAPYWLSYPEMVRLSDGVPVFIETSQENYFKMTTDQLEAAITPRTRALILNSPSNPTGMLYDESELEAIAAIAVKHGIYVISDEIYEHLVYDPAKQHISIASLGESIKNLTIVVNGVSKTYAMTGWRIGYTASNAQLARAMGDVQSHATSNPNSIAQAAAVAALDSGLECVIPMKNAFKERRDYLVERINAIEGVSAIMPDGAFYLMMNIEKMIGRTIEGAKITGSEAFAALLLDKANVALVQGADFGADGYVRWSYAVSLETIKMGVDRLEEFLGSIR